jgi:hypothetical protein
MEDEVVKGIIEARIDPQAAKPACRCVLHDMSVDVGKIIESAMSIAGVEWQGRGGRSIDNDIERVLDTYYTFSTCKECAPDKDGERCGFIGQGIV